jgi:tetratricopeptide (TPR) repeat protein
MSWFSGSKRATQSSEDNRKNSGYQTPIARIRSSKRRREKFKERVARLTEALKSSPLFLIGLVAVFLIVGILIAVSKRFLSPSQQVVVHPFEVSSDLAKDLKISGNAMSDIVSDDANEIVIEGGQFSGVSAGSSSSHFGAIPKTVHIPVKTSIPLTIKGISLDDAIQIYDWLRYKQVIISGDVYATDSTHAFVRMRVEGSEDDGSWSTPFNPSAPLEDTLKAESIRAMIRINPELVGRMYLKNHDLPNALATFAGWASTKPLNPLPYYFLAYIYYLDKSHDGILGVPRDDEMLQSQLMATQATQVASYQNICNHFAGHVRCFWFKLRDGLNGNPTPNVSDRAISSLADNDLDNGQYDSAYQKYSGLVKMYPADTNLQINLGVAAEGQGVLEKDNAQRIKKYQEALRRFQLAEVESPDNPLIKRNIGIELSKIGNNDSAVNYEETALLLRPSYFQALRMAVILLNAQHHYSQAADLCRTFFVLASPDKNALAQSIYGKRDNTTWSDTEFRCAHSFTASNQLWMSGQWITFAEGVNTLAKASTSSKSDVEDPGANSSQDHAHPSSVLIPKKDPNATPAQIR